MVLLWLVLVGVAAAAPSPSGPVLVLGDSLSAAYNMPESDGWVALLEDRLEERMPQPPEVINASISGETTAGGLNRLPALLGAHSPSLLVIELGGNDGLRGLPPSQIRDNIDQMLVMAGEAGARVVLVGIDIPPNFGSAYRERLRAIYVELAEEHEAAVLPFFLDGVALAEGMMQADGIHPTASAQPRLLDNLWPVLARELDLPTE